MAIKPPPRTQSSQLGLPLAAQGEARSPFDEGRSAALALLLDRIWWTKGMRCLEIGCGQGRSSRSLHHRLQAAQTLGIDKCAKSIRLAKSTQEEGLEFRRVDPLNWTPKQPFDLVLLNNPPEEFYPIMERAYGFLGEGAQMVLHLPRDRASPLTERLLQLSQSAEFEALFSTPADSPEVDLLALSEQLHRLGFGTQQVEEQVIAHRLGSPDILLQWLLEFALPPMRAARDPETSEAFRGKALAMIRADRAKKPIFWPTTHVLAWAKLP
jgi:trans-aconitate methyltransferase